MNEEPVMFMVYEGKILFSRDRFQTYYTAVNETGRPTPLNPSGTVRSTNSTGKVYFTDGDHVVCIDGNDCTVRDAISEDNQ